ncbi:hypothetical protein [Nonomuraea longicatena]|uniref:Uncharacterized protein n=1 Tax=Nonomuraea longicatena TaxID=83682 RepID=A0ABN1PJV4_9ACTN
MSDDFRQGQGWQQPPQPPYGPPPGPHVPPGGPRPYDPPGAPQPPYGPPSGPQTPFGHPGGPPPPPYGPPGGPQHPYPHPPHGGPQYGAQYGAQYGGPPPAQVRPPLWWIAAGWAVAAVCVITGIALFVTGTVGGLVDSAPSRTFAPGESVTLTIDPGEQPALYVQNTGRLTWECRIGKDGRLVTTSDQTLTSDGVTWAMIALVNVPAKGDYPIVCTVQEQVRTRFGLGRSLAAGAGGFFGGLAAMVILPMTGIVVGAAVNVVVVVRRNAHRRRLAAGG